MLRFLPRLTWLQCVCVCVLERERKYWVLVGNNRVSPKPKKKKGKFKQRVGSSLDSWFQIQCIWLSSVWVFLLGLTFDPFCNYKVVALVWGIKNVCIGVLVIPHCSI